MSSSRPFDSVADSLLVHASFVQRLARSLAGQGGDDLAQDTWTAALQSERGAEHRLDVKKATGDDMRKALASNGAGDLFPQLNPAETAKITKEGKIPVYNSWRDRVRGGTASWDGILTAAALASFAQDQQALDDRIRKQL